MRITITGTRRGLTFEQKEMAIVLLQPDDILIHGAADGVDSEIHVLGNNWCMDKIIYPANDVPSNIHNLWIKSNRDFVCLPLPALARNRVMVENCDLVLGFPKNFFEELRSGTWAALRYANKTNKPYLIVWPDGSIGQLDKWH